MLVPQEPLRIGLVEGVTDVCLMTATVEKLLDEIFSAERHRRIPWCAVAMRRRNLRLVKLSDSTDAYSHAHGSIGIVG
jgi:hypothetical protein